MQQAGQRPGEAPVNASTAAWRRTASAAGHGAANGQPASATRRGSVIRPMACRVRRKRTAPTRTLTRSSTARRRKPVSSRARKDVTSPHGRSRTRRWPSRRSSMAPRRNRLASRRPVLSRSNRRAQPGGIRRCSRSNRLSVSRKRSRSARLKRTHSRRSRARNRCSRRSSNRVRNIIRSSNRPSSRVRKRHSSHVPSRVRSRHSSHALSRARNRCSSRALNRIRSRRSSRVLSRIRSMTSSIRAAATVTSTTKAKGDARS